MTFNPDNSAASFYQLRCKTCNELEGPRKGTRIISCDGTCHNHYHVECAKLPAYFADLTVTHPRNIAFKCDECVSTPTTLSDVFRLLSIQQDTIRNLSDKIDPLTSTIGEHVATIRDLSDKVEALTASIVSDDDADSLVSEEEDTEAELLDLRRDQEFPVSPISDPVRLNPQPVVPQPVMVPDHVFDLGATTSEQVSAQNERPSTLKKPSAATQAKRPRQGTQRKPLQRPHVNRSRPKSGNVRPNNRSNDRKRVNPRRPHPNNNHQQFRYLNTQNHHYNQQLPQLPYSSSYGWSNGMLNPIQQPYQTQHPYSIPPLVIDNRTPNFHHHRQPSHQMYHLGQPMLF